MTEPATIILIGAGHVNLYIAAHAESLIASGARVLLIDPGLFWYSGMATGVLGGRYEAAEDQLNPQSLIEKSGGEFLQETVTAVKPKNRRIILSNGNQLAYDYLSINVGSRVKTEGFNAGSEDANVWPVKPIANLQKLRVLLEKRFRAGEQPRLAVVGGGPSGVEAAANLKALGRRSNIDTPTVLITKGKRLLPSAPDGASRWLHRKLIGNGLDLHYDTPIAGRERTSLVAADGTRIEADYVVQATGLQAHALVHNCELVTRAEDGLLVNNRLQSVAENRIFAGGDCAAMEDYALPKLGVFGVRQAAVIHANLLAILQKRPLTEYNPQKNYLAILNLGDKTALATRGRFWWNGRFSMKLKDFIDQRFINGYRQLA